MGGRSCLCSHWLLPCRLERPSDKLLIRVLGHTPALGAKDCFGVAIANEHTRPSTFGAGSWLLCLVVHQMPSLLSGNTRMRRRKHWFRGKDGTPYQSFLCRKAAETLPHAPSLPLKQSMPDVGRQDHTQSTQRPTQLPTQSGCRAPSFFTREDGSP